MRIAFLTSSRADYGIYLPLLKAMAGDDFFDVRLIVFGTHLSSFHGHTIDQIMKDHFKIDHKVYHILTSDTEEAIATSMSMAFARFTEIWAREGKNYDLVFCLGDRYEMFAAVSAGSPYRIPFAHLHGGETTLGAIDNEYRHCITLFSTLHFVATSTYAERVAEIKGFRENIYNVGSLSLENLQSIPKLSAEGFKTKFQVDFSLPSLLVTYHPETAGSISNQENAQSLVEALKQLEGLQVIITMPNADTAGNQMRKVYEEYARSSNNVILVENFGTEGYFNALNLCKAVVGNSSSGIIEAASFGKYVVNIGDRQKGRARSQNVIDCRSDVNSIVAACREAISKGEYKGENIYYRENVSQKIIEAVKSWVHQ